MKNKTWQLQHSLVVQLPYEFYGDSSMYMVGAQENLKNMLSDICPKWNPFTNPDFMENAGGNNQTRDFFDGMILVDANHLEVA